MRYFSKYILAYQSFEPNETSVILFFQKPLRSTYQMSGGYYLIYFSFHFLFIWVPQARYILILDLPHVCTFFLEKCGLQMWLTNLDLKDKFDLTDSLWSFILWLNWVIGCFTVYFSYFQVHSVCCLLRASDGVLLYTMSPQDRHGRGGWPYTYHWNRWGDERLRVERLFDTSQPNKGMTLIYSKFKCSDTFELGRASMFG